MNITEDSTVCGEVVYSQYFIKNKSNTWKKEMLIKIGLIYDKGPFLG